MPIGPQDNIERLLVKKYSKGRADSETAYKKGDSIVSPRTVLNTLGQTAESANVNINPQLNKNYKALCAQMVYRAPGQKQKAIPVEQRQPLVHPNRENQEE